LLLFSLLATFQSLILLQDASNQSLARGNWRNAIDALSWLCFGLFMFIFIVYSVKVGSFKRHFYLLKALLILLP
jgi:cell division protein FtsW (lipid II flippase)